MDPIDQLLQQRNESNHLRYRTAAVVAALLLHAVAAAAVLFGPDLFEKEPEFRDFVEVTVLPAAELGPGPQPEPAPPAPEPEPEPEVPEAPAETPALPDPEDEKSPPRSEPASAPALPSERADSEQPSQGRPASTGSLENASVASFDDPTFQYGYYVDRMIQAIREHWRPPRAPEGVELLVHFRILANGSIEELRIVRPSGIRAFDRAGLRAVEEATLPPLPRGYAKPSLGVTLIVRAGSIGA